MSGGQCWRMTFVKLKETLQMIWYNLPETNKQSCNGVFNVTEN